MTELQIKAAQLREDKRHNIANERLTREANAAQAQHYQTSDKYMQEHYTRSDASGLISANAAAMNAGTSRKKYEMEHDIEYGWTGDEGYPEGMPLSAQKLDSEILLLVGYGSPRADTEQEQRKTEVQKTYAQALNAAAGAAGSVLNAVFGKGGVVNSGLSVADYFSGD